MAGVTKPAGAASGAEQTSDGRKGHLALWIGVALVLGVAVGGWCHASAASPEMTEVIAGRFGSPKEMFDSPSAVKSPNSDRIKASARRVSAA